MESAFHSDALDDCLDFFAEPSAPDAYAVAAELSAEDVIFGNICGGFAVALAVPLHYGRCFGAVELFQAAALEPIAPSFPPYRHVEGARNTLRRSLHETAVLS